MDGRVGGGGCRRLLVGKTTGDSQRLAAGLVPHVRRSSDIGPLCYSKCTTHCRGPIRLVGCQCMAACLSPALSFQ